MHWPKKLEQRSSTCPGVKKARLIGVKVVEAVNVVDDANGIEILCLDQENVAGWGVKRALRSTNLPAYL
jgi:hypothetical protein